MADFVPADFVARRGFTYTVIDTDVIGCLYIYPSRKDPAVEYAVRSRT